ncbi:DUF2785 domain-containing protein [Tengunoibacter tsumagoiensis]|uniref:Membrane protein n=1 Tax=Tengunoibacter tsumagoiensis TaxID=2014871 RepID=A0A401ZW00_9CHLR|nr:DUF2785 domain-containing protein [Tengunoibacter tsumagoiensis]GCE10962.1 membrane protein [Tengunoibacter tsumagoiensis]
MSDIIEQAKDKQFLRPLAENNYVVPAELDQFGLAQALMQNLGSTDQELRDELSYMILASGIIGGQKLQETQLEYLLDMALDEWHLFQGIGESETDTVFMRSFSNLIIAALLYNDAHQPTFTEAKVRRVKEELLRYAQEERDWRGYVKGKGWAHAMAHLADTLDECAQNHFMGVEDRKEILNVVKQLVSIKEPLEHEEDSRLANVAYRIILGKQVEDEYLSSWIDACAESLAQRQHPDYLLSSTNMRNFLRSLYFFLYWDNIASVRAIQILNLLKQHEVLYVGKQIVE